MSNDPIIGIDLGTTNSVVAAMVGGEIEILENTEGNRVTPSVVTFPDPSDETKTGTYVGKNAVNIQSKSPELTVESAKQHMGTDVVYEIGDVVTKEYSPVQVSAQILRKLKTDAERDLGQEVKRAVITVPADFNESQRQHTQDAAKIADLSVVQLLNEPTAACLAYGIKDSSDRTVLVYDLGGGTCDVSIVSVANGFFEVIASQGDNVLGGDDWDARILEWLLDHIERKYEVKIPDDPIINARLMTAAKKAKEELSGRNKTTIQIPHLGTNQSPLFDQPLHVEVDLTREEFNKITQDLFGDTLVFCTEVLDEAGLIRSDIDDILLVGGSIRMPQVREGIESYFDQTPSKNVNPDEVVARGAAAKAAIKRRTLPVSAQGKDERQPTLTTDEGDVDLTDIVVIDVTSRSLGVEVRDTKTGDRKYHELIGNNVQIPTAATDDFRPHTSATGHPGAKGVDIRVLENKTTNLTDAEQMGTIELRGLDPSIPISDQRIDVTFNLTEDNILEVTAIDTITGLRKEAHYRPKFAYTDHELAVQKSDLPDIF